MCFQLGVELISALGQVMLTIEKWMKSNRSWLTSGDIILILSLQLVAFDCINAGNPGDMMYVTLFLISWSQVTVTENRNSFMQNVNSLQTACMAFWGNQGVAPSPKKVMKWNKQSTYTHSMRQNQEHIDPSMIPLADGNRKHSNIHPIVDHLLWRIPLQREQEKNSTLAKKQNRAKKREEEKTQREKLHFINQSFTSICIL